MNNNKLLDTILHLIKIEHEQLCKRDLPKISELLDELINNQTSRDQELMDLSSLFDELKTEIEIHVLEEDQFLLPLTERVLSNNVEDTDELELIKHTVEAFANQHDHFDNKCDRLIETSRCVSVREDDMLMGKVDFGGVLKQVCFHLTPQVQVDEYVIVHVGFALQIIDEAEAQQIFAFLEKIDELDDLGAGESETSSEGVDCNVESAS